MSDLKLTTEELTLLDSREKIAAAIKEKNDEITDGDREFEASREAYSELRARREGEKRALMASQDRVGVVLEKIRLAIPAPIRTAPELAESALKRHELTLPALERAVEHAARVAKAQPSQESNALVARAERDLEVAVKKRAELAAAVESARATLGKTCDEMLAAARAAVEKTDEDEPEKADKAEKKKRAARGA